MKKTIFILLMAVGLVSFTQMEKVEDLFLDVTNTMKHDPSGTVYGVTQSNKDNIVVNTPVGEYTVNKSETGEYSFLGITAKLKSRKGNKYTIESSLGEYEIDINKCVVIKK